MKKNIRIFCGIIILSFAFVIFVIMRKSRAAVSEDLDNTMGSYSNYEQTEPDDDFSENVMSAVGDSFIYKGKKSYEKYGTVYEFFLFKKSPESLVLISEAINECDGYVEGQSEIRIEDGGAGYCYTVIKLFNYCNTDQGILNYDGYYSMRIESDDMTSIWEDPAVYKSFEGIKRLELPNNLQEKADEEGIDWYELWPELEEVVVYDPE